MGVEDIVHSLGRWPGARHRGVDPHAALRVAAFTSPELEALGRTVGFSMAVVAVTTDPRRHAVRMARNQHACWSLAEDRLFDGVGGEEVDPLPPSFEQLRFDPRWMGGRRLPAGVAVESGSILVGLPRDAHARFADELKACLAPRRFDVVGARPGRVLHRRLTRRPLVVGPRYSCSPGMGDGAAAFTPVDDLYAFRPKDLPALAAAVVASRERVGALRTLAGRARAPCGA